MKEQLDKLEDAVTRLAVAFDDLKKENAALRQSLADKEAALKALQDQNSEVSSRIGQLIETLTADLPAEK